MDKCIDLFSRLLIATITFVVPIFINLLSSFSEGEKRRKELSKQTEEFLTRQAAAEMQSDSSSIKETIAKTHSEFQKNDKQTKRELELLDPISQFWRIFATLVISFLSLSLNYLIRENKWNFYNHTTSIITLIVVVISYLVALFYLIRILYTIRKTKKTV